MLVHHFLQNSAQKYPDKNAVWSNGEWSTYAVLENRSNAIASFLVSNNIRRGDRIALLWDNSPEYITAYYSILKAGAVVVALNTETTSEVLHQLLTHSDASAIFISNKYSKYLVPILNKLPLVKFILSDEAFSDTHNQPSACFLLNDICTNYAGSAPDINTIDIDLSSIVYTSGSTGEPKGVMLSHLNICANTRSIVDYLSITPDDRILVVLPFYYVYGKTLLNTHFLAGGSVVLDNKFMYPNTVLQTMRDQQVTGFAGVPSTFMIILNKSAISDYVPFEHLRYITQAGGGMAVSYQKQVAETFAPAKLFIMYGATELSPRLTYVPPDAWIEKIGSIGISIPNTEAFIADENGNRLPTGETGEIVGRGSNVMMGYWKDPQGTANVVRNGLYFTGDLGTMDRDGFIYVVGRSKEMLKIGGNRVSAKEIENALLELPDIHEAAVIGVPDQVLEEAAKAFIVKKPDSNLDESFIKKALSSKIPMYKIPKYFEFLQSLPKNESGKILKVKLKELHQNS